MALIMNDEQRAKALEGYDPKERLIQVGKDKQSGKAVLYYPAAWRLYELHLRYPNANFKSEIIYHDEQKGTVIVKAYLYLGKNYDESDKKAEAMKQGNILSLDKVETAAKARCARDFGIGTEYALDMVADETDATHDNAPVARHNGHQEAPAPVKVPTWEEVYRKGIEKGTWKKETFYATASALLDAPVHKENVKALNAQQLMRLNQAIEAEPVAQAS